MLQTELSRRLGVDIPIWNAGMGGASAGPALAAAVSNAGGLGVVGMGGCPPPLITAALAQTRTLTDRPFGVNLILALLEPGQVEASLDAGPAVLVLFWGDPAPHIADAHRAGALVAAQVGSLDEAKAAAQAGVDVVMVQGVEAGGHVRGTTPLGEVLPGVVSAVAPLPVVAAGGIGDGRGVASALRSGAQGVSVGTRFLCSEEAGVPLGYKERITKAEPDDTVLTKMWDIGWPDAQHRALRNRVYEEWEAAGSPPPGQRPGEGSIIGSIPVAGTTIELPRYGMFPPLTGFEGDLDLACLYAGMSCGVVNDIRPAADILRQLAEEAEAALAWKPSVGRPTKG